jgi:hypothetical protein
MNKNLFAIALFVLATAFATTGCDKDDPKTNADLIIGNWKTTAATVSPELPFIGSDIFAQYDPCDKDDIAIFEPNGVFKSDEGATKCDPNDPQTLTGTYAFNPDQTVLTVNDGVDPQSYNIVELTESTMRASFTENSTGVVYTYTVTFTKQ